MKFLHTAIADVFVVEPEISSDVRGQFLESYNRKVFLEQGIDVEFVQDNQSVSSKGVLRGLHYQLAPHAQAKLVRVVKGEIFLSDKMKGKMLQQMAGSARIFRQN